MIRGRWLVAGSFTGLLVAFGLAVSLVGCEGPACITLPCSGITGEATIAVGQTTTLEVTQQVWEPEVTDWRSSDPSVAIVDQTGTVTGIGTGEAVIRARVGFDTDCCDDRTASHPIAVTDSS